MVADFLRAHNKYDELTQQTDFPTYAHGEDWRFKEVALLGVTSCPRCKTTWSRDKNAAMNLTLKAWLILTGRDLPACWREDAWKLARADEKQWRLRQQQQQQQQ